MSILIVDDSQENRAVLQSILKHAGFTQFLTAGTANEAFKELGIDDSTTVVEGVDLILMDIIMPEIDGIEACRQIKAVPQLRDIPIIMVTGLAEAKSLEAAFDVGAADYINKPVNRVEVLARVRSALMLKQEVDVRKLAYIELEQESLAKSQILSTVTHELKTPLTSIVGYSDRLLLRQEQVGQLNDRQQKYVKAIRDSSRELTVLISDLLDVSRIEAGRIEIELTNLEVRHKIEDIVQNVQTQLEEKQINLVRDMPPDSCEAKVDENRFSQIFNNLLSNACKYSSVGATVTITVKQDPDFLQFDISDTGMGISAVDQSKLFTKYFRADNTATRDESGTGLGLFITKLLVEAHGGAIWVDSKEGIGSTFSFTLPRADIDVTQMEASVVSLG